MIELTRFIVVIIALIIIYRTAELFVRRAIAVRRIKRLGELRGVKVIFPKSPYLSLFRLSKNPDIIVDMGSKAYIIRLISGKGKLKRVHFASPEFFVVFNRTVLLTGTTGRRFRVAKRAGHTALTLNRRTYILPPLKIPKEYNKRHDLDEREIIPTLIFSPAPHAVSYVTPERTSIKVAFTGDEIFGARIYTASTFERYIDRESRELYNNYPL